MLLSKNTLESLTISLTKVISYETNRASDYKKTNMLSTLGFEPKDITLETLNHKVFISSKNYKDTLVSIANKELDIDGLKAQFNCESVDLQLAIKEQVELLKVANTDKEVGKRGNKTVALNGALSITNKGNYQLNYFNIYEQKNMVSTLKIKGEVATKEQIESLVPFWSAKKTKAMLPKENLGFAKKLGINKGVTYRNLGLDNIIQ